MYDGICRVVSQEKNSIKKYYSLGPQFYKQLKFRMNPWSRSSTLPMAAQVHSGAKLIKASLSSLVSALSLARNSVGQYPTRKSLFLSKSQLA